MPEPISQEEYVSRSGLCPLCKTEDIIRVGEPLEFLTPDILYQPVECENCGAGWSERLKIVGYMDLDNTGCILQAIREQVVLMDDFMSKTPGGKHKPLWWSGEMPAYPKGYDPAEWQAENKAIFLIWLDYLAELEHANLHDYRALADKLNVADLLAASKKESNK